MRGMTRSVITIAGRNVVTFSSASSPSFADSAAKPQLFTSCSRPTRAAASSSTMSTRSTVDTAVSDVVARGSLIGMVIGCLRLCRFYILSTREGYGKLYRGTNLHLNRVANRLHTCVVGGRGRQSDERRAKLDAGPGPPEGCVMRMLAIAIGTCAIGLGTTVGATGSASSAAAPVEREITIP